jgi:hypothetical protein
MDEDRISVVMLKKEAERLSSVLGLHVEAEALLYVLVRRWLAANCDMDESQIARLLINQLYTGNCGICGGRWGVSDEDANHKTDCPYADYHNGFTESEYYNRLLKPRAKAA